jgi:hypothetical protein
MNDLSQFPALYLSGADGRNGRNGRDGRDARDARFQTIVASRAMQHGEMK